MGDMIPKVWGSQHGWFISGQSIKIETSRKMRNKYSPYINQWGDWLLLLGPSYPYVGHMVAKFIEVPLPWVVLGGQVNRGRGSRG